MRTPFSDLMAFADCGLDVSPQQIPLTLLLLYKTIVFYISESLFLQNLSSLFKSSSCVVSGKNMIKRQLISACVCSFLTFGI